MAPDPRTEAVSFFDAFVEAFASFSGTRIAERYLAPYSALHADGSTNCLQTHAAIEGYFQGVVDSYSERGCRSCRYADLEVTPIGTRCVLGTVTWDLLHEDGSVMSSWRESYTLVRGDGGMKIFASIDHAK